MLFLRGYLEKSEIEAKLKYQELRVLRPWWAAKFRLIEAESMVSRGKYEDAERVFRELALAFANSSEDVERLAFEAQTLSHLQRFSDANARLTDAEGICEQHVFDTCGLVPRMRGVLAVEKGEFAEAHRLFSESLGFARAHHDPWLEASALSNLGVAALQQEHFDEAADWSNSAYRAATDLGAEDLAQRSMGNLGWAFFGLGDADRALEFFLEAEKRAAALGDLYVELNWLTTTGDVYQERGDLARATESYRRALILARQLNSKEDIVNALEDLAQAAIDGGKINDADAYIQELGPSITASGNRLDLLYVEFAKARIAAARQQWNEAENRFRMVERDPASQTSMRMGAEHELANLYEVQGDTTAADRMYRTALNTFESARSEIKNEDSKLPFLANATSLYGDYIRFLVAQSKSEEALLVADQSRAQTLAQGLGLATKSKPGAGSAMRPEMIARKTDATLLFYWLGEKQSFLWAITPSKTSLFPLPPRHEIAQVLRRYNKTLLGFTDSLERADADGLALFRILVAPASSLIPPGGNVVVLCDGELSQLNFETLIVPGQHPHYWIEDATLVSAPSLHLLAASRPAETHGRKLLLFGDAISPNSDYPELPMAAVEMKQIEQHFARQDQTVYAREKATAPAYLAANPQQFAYIHFVAHGVASRTDPLDSAIILSRANGAEDSFKLHARDILRYPLRARLVTIAACYGSGSRSYAGEGLIGLAWAFLRAGAHNVIGALWEASDEATAQLTGDLYQGLERGMTPAAALRSAKLSLLHSQREFRKPFYWAPFQIYSGL